MKKKIITMVIGAEIVIIATVIIFLFYINSDAVKVNRQLELAQRYLLEEDYEQAIAAFGIVIDIDPKNVDAYIGMAEAYAAADELGNAVRTLEKAAEQTGSEEVFEMLHVRTAEIGKRGLAAQKAAEAAALASSVAAEAAALESSEVATNTMENKTNDLQCTMVEKHVSEKEIVPRGFIVQNGELYYYDETGNFVTGWFEKNNNCYCARTDGRLYKDGEHDIDGMKYLFDQDGICLGGVENNEWKQVYINHLKNVQVDTYPKCSLIYLDNDDIPEMVLLGSCEAVGNAVLSYSDNEVHEMYTDRKWFSYIERQSLLCDSGGLMGAYCDTVYSLIDGAWICIGKGNYETKDDTLDPDLWVFTYYWNGNEVTEELYYKELGDIYDYNKAIDVYDEGISLEDMIDKLGKM